MYNILTEGPGILSVRTLYLLNLEFLRLFLKCSKDYTYETFPSSPQILNFLKTDFIPVRLPFQFDGTNRQSTLNSRVVNRRVK